MQTPEEIEEALRRQMEELERATRELTEAMAKAAERDS